MERVLRVYSQLMEQVEKEPFCSDELASVQQRLVTREGKASRAIRRLSRIVGALDQRFSMAGLLLNVLYLRDMRQAMALERWLKTHARHFEAWFEALAATDALCSLGGFAFNHPDYVYPDLAEGGFRMEGKALGHPLLHREKCVRNDVLLPRSPYFLVITGANMAGKSTYLRTVGVNFLLACMGLPVCADSLTVCPASLMTSLRTADSLTANESYFFAELKRLKTIIDRLHAGEELFIILDEVLKGTNSKDKQKGSLALVRQLIAQKTCGLIATHDLLLGTLEEEFPGEVENYCFEADISGDNLLFTYRLRKGIARNMNACFLMKKMGITL
jgi:DNA mismatch repair ATPase MutS